MAARTRIAWADATWNPLVGCTRVSDGCRHCYAERLVATRQHEPAYAGTARMTAHGPRWTGTVRLLEDRLRKPDEWSSPRRVFVNAMADLFHEQVTGADVARVFGVMADVRRHTFMVLTKRPERAASWPGPWPPNVWLGVSVENRAVLHRIDTLRRCGAHLRFLSCEPLLEPLGALNLSGIGWVIVGGESGRGHRPMRHAWARAVRDQCAAAGVPFFFKQSAADRPETGRALHEADGSTSEWQQVPGAATQLSLFPGAAA